MRRLKLFSRVTLLALVATLAVVASTLASTNGSQDFQPPGPVTNADTALEMAKHRAAFWGEQSPQVVSVSKVARSEWMQRLEARGEQVRTAGNGGVWVVEFTGRFTPNRWRAGLKPLTYSEMHVVIDAQSGLVVNTGATNPIPTSP